MIQKVYSWQDVIAKVKEEHPGVNQSSFKFKHLLATEAEIHNLSWNLTNQLAHYVGIKLYPRPNGLPETWPITLCKSYLAQKYINPLDPSEWLVVMHPDALGCLPYLIHRTPLGFADARWFYEIVPELANIVKDPTIGHPFSMTFNEAVNQKFASQRNGRGMTPGQIQTINLFFQQYVPGLEGVCSTCFKVMLPMSGAGERWIHNGQNEKTYEVRLSAAKPMGKNAQRTEYVSQTIIDQNQNPARKYALWDTKNCRVGYTNNMKQEATHIPWEIYDYNKFNVDMPICLCKQEKR